MVPRFHTPLTRAGRPATLSLRSYDFFYSVALSETGIDAAASGTETLGAGVNSGIDSLPADWIGFVGFPAATRSLSRQQTALV